MLGRVLSGDEWQNAGRTQSGGVRQDVRARTAIDARPLTMKKSTAIPFAIPGRCTFTATSSPVTSSALYTWKQKTCTHAQVKGGDDVFIAASDAAGGAGE